MADADKAADGSFAAQTIAQLAELAPHLSPEKLAGCIRAIERIQQRIDTHIREERQQCSSPPPSSSTPS